MMTFFVLVDRPWIILFKTVETLRMENMCTIQEHHIFQLESIIANRTIFVISFECLNSFELPVFRKLDLL